MYFSVIVPVYNRRGEVRDLLESLSRQTARELFEVLIVEDGSSEPCRDIVQEYNDKLRVKYFFKANEGRSIARNFGIERAGGEYFVFFDSDCVIPPRYFETLHKALERRYVDCFGGPDAASDDFTATQKAINFAMTSFLTTGGIRGGRHSLEKFVPRSFNMGYSRDVWEKVGGFREMFSEDIDMSTRIRQAKFHTMLIPEVPVYHKRRGNLWQFARQTYVFGMSRITLKLLYPKSLKIVHCLPALFTIGFVVLLIMSLFGSWMWSIPLMAYALALLVAALTQTHNAGISLLAVVASHVMLLSYGWGFIKAFVWKILLRHGRNEAQEIAMRRGK